MHKSDGTELQGIEKEKEELVRLYEKQSPKLSIEIQQSIQAMNSLPQEPEVKYVSINY